MFNLYENTAIVVGGSGDLGSSIVEAFIEYGCKKVVVIDIKTSTTVSSESFDDDKITYLKCDISDPSECDLRFKEALELLSGRLDILVHCAGIQRRCRSDQFDDEMWSEVIKVNLDSVFLFMRFASSIMIDQGYGKIINVGSINGNFGGLTIPAYSASKGAVEQLAKSFCNDLAKFGININTISPGYFDTELNTGLISDPSRVQEVISRIPQGRWGNPEDIKGLSVFLASRASDYINGANIVIDGGYSGR